MDASRPLSAGHAILVLGMHRSGTSALARTLALCGAGLPATLFPAVPGDNDAGYWESSEVIDFHQRLLWHLGTGMLDPTLPAEGWLATPIGRWALDEAIAIASREWGTHPTWVVKEPRMCRLLPLWIEALRTLGRATVAVHGLREPAEVAASLARRDGMERDRVELLWLQHVAAAERDTRGLPRVFVRYDDLLADWRSVVGRVATLLPQGTLEPDAAAIEGFLDPGLRRQRRPADPPIAQPVRALRDELLAAATQGREPQSEIVDEAWSAACSGLTTGSLR
jgi:hypothetical protein